MSPKTECRRLVLSMYLNSACCADFPDRRWGVDDASRPNFCWRMCHSLSYLEQSNKK